MKTGLFVRHVEEVDLQKLRENGCVFLGDEGCVYKLPHEAEIIQLKNNLEHAEIHIITPLVSQKNLQYAKDTLDELISTRLIHSLTFNDYGLLYYAVNKHPNSHVKFYLGRLLTKSFSDCPWSDHLNRDEDDSIKTYMNGFVLNDPRKINLFKNMGIVGAHLNVSKKNIEGLNEITETGLEVIVHLNTIIGAASRICSQAQYSATLFPDCKEECEQPSVLKLSKLWSIKARGYVDPSKEVQQIVPDYYVSGNITYYRNPDHLFLLNRSSLFAYGIVDCHVERLCTNG
ncbi:hypothetical protein DFP94_102209 [Fontibacillus phaseoli]|uniref:Uncharacterized protein n=1 Tax=Fontibacillus phaseoli TaxID=1416533 RepID=A0A369BLI6_9BACL|nr:hypothetical protein [Fontibacillus phaseoli]RCX21456.1 hypothetical protein DFP94_102209 [Fontibacillus phaseoli]